MTLGRFPICAVSVYCVHILEANTFLTGCIQIYMVRPVGDDSVEMLCQATTSGKFWDARAVASSNGYTLSLIKIYM